MDELTELEEGLWTLRRPFSFLGLQFGVRVTIVRLPSGDLWVHSPIELTPGLRANVDALGTVAHLVAPNYLHHMYVGPWQEAYPNAVLHAPEALKRKRKDLRIDRTHEEGPASEWGGVFTTVALEGMPQFGETYFVHAPTETLITADLVLAIEPDVPSWMTRSYLKMIGILDKPLGCSLVHKLTTRDKAAVRRAVDKLLALPWKRLIVSHGKVLERSDLHELVREAYSWLPAT